MTEPRPAEDCASKLIASKAKNSTPDNADSGTPASDAPSLPQPSAEEQLALYEKELRENDWGHQPC